MRTLFIIPLVLMCLVSFPSWGLSMDDLVERRGIYYKKFSDVPFTGETDGFWRGSFKDGKREGSFEFYWESGDLRTKGNFKDNQRHGFWISYFENGQLFFKGEYKNGNEEGYWEEYRKDGSVLRRRTGTYKNGVKVSH